MPDSSAAPAVAPFPPTASLSNGCATVDAMDRQTAAIDRQTAAITEQSSEIRKLRQSVRAGIRQVQPACASVRGLCHWAKTWGPRLMWSAPGVLVAIGAISPNAAEALKAALRALGLQ